MIPQTDTGGKPLLPSRKLAAEIVKELGEALAEFSAVEAEFRHDLKRTSAS